MKHFFPLSVCLAVLVIFLNFSRAGAAEKYDVVVYGGTSAAVVAAVQAKKMGKSVIVLSPDKHLGGLSSGGLGFTDSGNTGTIGGLSREFYRRVYSVYQDENTWRWQKPYEYANVGQGTKAMLHDDKTMWIFEPHVAEKVFEDWITEMKIPVRRPVLLDREKGVVKKGTRIVSITTLCGKTVEGKVFIDATYEGDLMAAAGCEYHVGREANDVHKESWNGNQVGVLHHAHWFKKPVDPYVVPGNPGSGRLHGIDDSKPGTRGEGDSRVQAYCFRMCLTDNEPNRVPFPKPKGYDPADYELLLRVFNTGWREAFHKFDRIPNHKTDTNNHGPFSTDYIGMNYEYPDASYEKRAEIIADHVRYQQGLMYFLANDPRVPSEIRSKMGRWGLAKDEFIDNGHWPHQIYVREARRLVGEYVTTEHECLGKRRCPKPVGMGSYTLDSHNVRRYITPESTVQNEGDIGVHPQGPYGIDFGSLVPKRGQCTNLVVPVCVSCTHIAFGSIRMEPVFMILGQSAATIATMAIDENIDVQDLSYEKLRRQLVEDGQRLDHSTQLPARPGVKWKEMAGIVHDDTEAKLTGVWHKSDSNGKYCGNGYLHDNNEEKGLKKAVFQFELPEPGTYEVRIAYTAHANRANNVPVGIRHAEGEKTAYLNQKEAPPIDGFLKQIGKFKFNKNATVTISNTQTNGHVVVDAVQLLKMENGER